MKQNSTTKHKWLKRIAIAAACILCLWLVFLYSLDLRKTADRSWGDYPLDKNLKGEVINRCSGLEDPDEIIERCCDIATDRLSFWHTNRIENGEANCIGYARLTSSLLNCAFRNRGIKYKAKPVVGRVHSFGINLHPIALAILPSALHPSFKDHDFVEITTPDGVILVDTSLEDVLGREFIFHRP